MESIRIAALGRPVNLGDLYDYNSGTFKSIQDLYSKWKPSRWSDTFAKSITPSFLIQHEANLESFLGLNAASRRSIQKQPVEWFRQLQQHKCPAGKVQVIVRLQRSTKTDSIEVDNIREHLSQRISKDYHLVRQINYGGQLIVALQLDVNESDRQEVQDELLLASVSFFHQLGGFSQRPEILNRTVCRVYSDVMDSSDCISFSELLTRYLFPFATSDLKWVPQEFQLCPIGKSSSAQIEDWQSDVLDTKNTLTVQIEKATKQSQNLLHDSFFQRVPHLKEHVAAFSNSLTSLSSFLNSVGSSPKPSRQNDYKPLCDAVTGCWHWVTYAAFDQWLATKRREIQRLSKLLTGISLKFVAPELLDPSDKFQVFLLSTSNEPDLLIEEMSKRSKPNEKLKPFRFYRLGKESDEHFSHVKSQLMHFESTAKSRKSPSFISTSDRYEDEAVVARNLNLIAKVPYNDSKASVMIHKPVIHAPTKVERPTAAIEQGDSPLKGGQPSANYLNVESNRTVYVAHRRDSQGNVVGSVTGEWQGQRASYNGETQSQTSLNRSELSSSSISKGHRAHGSTEVTNFDRNAMRSSGVKESKIIEAKSSYPVSQRIRVAEGFLGSSKLLKGGNPSVYFLTSSQRQSASLPLRWFEIGRPNKSKEHKTIILMGATGSGKSRLVDAMVNYVLGVRWEDPIRFRIVPDEGRSQALSQTRHITSYTIHHVEGMAVPYSLTIIDTPGFGDTGGLRRDEEITRTICSFLTENESDIHEINAVGFVASSADARLTPTQKYVISSVLSLFGKDVIDHIRLLVTFSDGALPPVVEACRQAGFPLIHDPQAKHVSGFSKFNNSVLFASNGNTEDAIIDRTFWLMAERGFDDFFTVLAQLPPKSLMQTKRVAETRIEHDKRSQTIEQLLDECIKKIGQIQYADQSYMSINKEIQTKIERKRMESEPVVVKVKCPRNWFAFNCDECQVTCVQPMERSKCREWTSCPNNTCHCPVENHTYRTFSLAEEERAIRYKDSKQIDIDVAKRDSYQSVKSRHEQELDSLKNDIVRILREVSTAGQELGSIAWNPSATTPEELVNTIRTRLERDKSPNQRGKMEILKSCLEAVNNQKRNNSEQLNTSQTSKTSKNSPPKAKNEFTKTFSLRKLRPRTYNESRV